MIISEMDINKVTSLIKLFNKRRMLVIIDGGWGVDALLGKQTRAHSDLDIAVPHKNVSRIRKLLGTEGFKEIPRNDSWECNIVLGDDEGYVIDVHSYTFDENKKNIFGINYPFESLSGKGTINGLPVRCISPEWVVKFHTNYKPAEKDYHDVKLLCEKFDIKVPDEYKNN
jgi:lincosamide nucleotidyltransferase A/C/D/E